MLGKGKEVGARVEWRVQGKEEEVGSAAARGGRALGGARARWHGANMTGASGCRHGKGSEVGRAASRRVRSGWRRGVGWVACGPRCQRGGAGRGGARESWLNRTCFSVRR